jgi:Flp pilus assembly protein TadG
MSPRRKASLRKSPRRRGAVVVLAAFLMIVMMGMVAFSVDMGYILLVKTELQTAADSAALAAGAKMSSTRTVLENTAINYGKLHKAGGSIVNLASTDIEYGVWDQTGRTFTATNGVGNALRVTARRNNDTGGNGLFFAKVLGKKTYDVSASAIALGNPRDICFVVDLSGSMNDDTEPGYSGTGTITGTYAAIRNTMMQEVFTDLNFGTYPGTQQKPGQALGVSTFSALTNSSSSPLRSSSIPSTYRITSGDSSSTRQTKAYRWMIDYQVASIMPNGRPVPNSSNSASLAYWREYLESVTGQDNANQNIGYRTYVDFMMNQGRDLQIGTQYSQMSVASGNCPYHSETVGTVSYSFPPREQPTHSCRRSLIASIQEIKAKNINIPDLSQRDWVSIVTFDTVAGTVLLQSLTGDYDAAIAKCTTMQAVSDTTWSTATETGLIGANNHLTSNARTSTQRVVVLLTDGMPNLKTSSNTTISTYRTNTPSDYFYGGTSNYNHDAALMQVSAMQAKGWTTYAVGVGLGTDDEFMDRVMKMSTNEADAEAPQTSGDPAEYETELRAIFKQIVDTPRVRLVE